MSNKRYIQNLDELDSSDVSTVGGKNASLGEMTRHLRAAGVRVPEGFATTAQAYRDFLEEAGLESRLRDHMERLSNGERSLADTGRAVRQLLLESEFPRALAEAIRQAYADLGRRIGRTDPDVAVRSSATAEDLPEASFAGQQETFLNVRGGDSVIEACRRCYASLFTDRAISYRENNGFDHLQVALSVGIQRMVRSDHGSSGVMFSIDTETGFPSPNIAPIKRRSPV